MPKVNKLGLCLIGFISLSPPRATREVNAKMSSEPIGRRNQHVGSIHKPSDCRLRNTGLASELVVPCFELDDCRPQQLCKGLGHTKENSLQFLECNTSTYCPSNTSTYNQRQREPLSNAHSHWPGRRKCNGGKLVRGF
jgi:hypothetical protein